MPIIFIFAVCNIGYAQTFPVTTISQTGNDDKRINISYLPDGFTSAELSLFITEATAFNDELFSQTPFSNYKNFFNAYAIEVPSAQSGADHPGTATDINEPAIPVTNVDTYFGSTFDFGNIHRLLVATDAQAISSVLADNTPAYDQSMVIVNSTEYGGSGGPYSTSSINQSGAEIAIHEIGHSFAYLSDEYYAGDIYAGENFNMTQNTNPQQVRWNEWFGDQGIGIYRHCCGSTANTWYRPHQNCKMKNLGAPFCAVCTQRIIDVIYALVTPIDAYTPTQNNLSIGVNDQAFSLDLILPMPNTLNIEWMLNGALYANGPNNILISKNDLINGNNVLQAIVIDETSLSRTFLPGEGYEFTVTWNISNANCPSIINIDGVISDGSYLAGDLIRSEGVIPSNGQVQFESPMILLKPGFHAEFNSEFLAQDGGCN